MTQTETAPTETADTNQSPDQTGSGDSPRNRDSAISSILSSLQGVGKPGEKNNERAAETSAEPEPEAGQESPPAADLDSPEETGTDLSALTNATDTAESIDEDDPGSEPEAEQDEVADESANADSNKPWYKHKLEKQKAQIAKLREELAAKADADPAPDQKPTTPDPAVAEDVLERFMTEDQRADLTELQEAKTLKTEVTRLQRLYARDPDAALSELQRQNVQTGSDPEAWFESAQDELNDRIQPLAPLERLHKSAAKQQMKQLETQYDDSLKKMLPWYADPKSEGNQYITASLRTLPRSVQKDPRVKAVLAQAYVGSMAMRQQAQGTRPTAAPRSATPKKPARSTSRPQPASTMDPSEASFKEAPSRANAMALIKSKLANK